MIKLNFLRKKSIIWTKKIKKTNWKKMKLQCYNYKYKMVIIKLKEFQTTFSLKYIKLTLSTTWYKKKMKTLEFYKIIKES